MEKLLDEEIRDIWFSKLMVWKKPTELDMRFARELEKYLREKYDSSNEKRKSDPC